METQGKYGTFLEQFSYWCNKYNPITQLFIRPALKIVDAHNHKLRGGVAAAAGSAVGHYVGVVCIYESENLYNFVTNTSAPIDSVDLVNLIGSLDLSPLDWHPAVQALIGFGAAGNLLLGIGLHIKSKL